MGMTMNLKVVCAVFGVVFLLIGVAAFVPAFISNGLLFGVFMVDPVHNVIHILSGLVALVAAMDLKYSMLYFKVFGVVYALVALLGFFTHDLLIMQVNMADNLLHTVIALAALYFGFVHKEVQT